MEVKINAIHFEATEKLNDFINKKVDKLAKKNELVSTAEIILKVVKPETAMNKEASVRLTVPRSEDLFASKVALPAPRCRQGEPLSPERCVLIHYIYSSGYPLSELKEWLGPEGGCTRGTLRVSIGRIKAAHSLLSPWGIYKG